MTFGKPKEENDGSAIAKQEQCSLAISGSVMHGKEWPETVLAFWREMPMIKLIAMSGEGCHTDMLAVATSFGADLTIHKPIEFDTLLTSIAARLRKQ